MRVKMTYGEATAWAAGLKRDPESSETGQDD